MDPNVFTDWRQRLGWTPADFAFGATNPSYLQLASAGGHKDCVRRALFGVAMSLVMGGSHIFTYPLVNEHSNGTWPFIVDFPIKNGDFPLLC